MSEPTTTFVSVDRAKLKEDRSSGTRQGVIRVQRGTMTQFGTEAQILGASTVKYRLDPPPGVPNVWIETEADVRIGSAPPPTAMPPSPASQRPQPRPLLSRLMQTELLQLAIQKLRGELAAAPQRPDLLHRLGDLERQIGDHAAALQTFKALHQLRPADPIAARLTAILEGRAERLRPWPEPFVLTRDFLPPDELERLLAFTASQREAFAPTKVRFRGDNAYDPNARWCTNIWAIDDVAAFIVPRIEAQLPAALAQLGVAPQSFELKDAKITQYGDGGFFGPHVDRGAGVETRVAGFILYFYFPPKRFTGGGLAIYDRDLQTGEPATSCTTIIPEQNHLVLLGSDCWHEVLPVRCPPDDWDASRFTFSGWVCRT